MAIWRRRELPSLFVVKDGKNRRDLFNASVPPDVLGRAYEYLIKRVADDAGAKAGEFFTPPEVVDTLVRILEPRSSDSVYDPTCGSGGMLVNSVDFLREGGQHATSAAAPFFGRGQTQFTVASSCCRTKAVTARRFVYLQAVGAPRAKCSSALRGTLG